jgi:hypothetical protein
MAEILVRGGLAEMTLRHLVCMSALFLCCAGSSQAAQNEANQDIFTISVVGPTQAKDVQVRYYFTGEFGHLRASAASATDDNKIVIKTAFLQGKPAKTLKLIAYAPGCQFVTISVDDLAASNRQGEFKCTPLNPVQFYGKADISRFAEKALQVSVLYNCEWAGDFFGVHGAFSPFSVGRAKIDFDGSFTISLPDFSSDPLWDSLSNKATLMFVVGDGATGHSLAALRPVSDSAAKGGGLKVAPGYPQVEFRIESN